MRFLSLCSGIEAASCAWEPLGWTPVAFAEFDPESKDGGFAAALLAHYWPHVPNLGDISLITEQQIAALGPIDLVVGGTPCQDLSVAGLRAGIDGERSALFFHFVRIFDAARRFCGARWCLWENVPGALSSNDGRDFARVVSALAGGQFAAPLDGFGSEGLALGDIGLVEWAVLDAQWFHLAQRRERVFALLDSGEWSRRQPVLLEPESMRGDPPTRRGAGASVAGSLTKGASIGGGPRCGSDEAAANQLIPEVADPLVAKEGGTYTHEGENNFRLRNVVGAPAVAVPLTHGAHPGSNVPGRRKEDDYNIVACFDTTQITHPENRSRGDPETAALAASAHPPAVAFKPSHYTRDKDGAPSEVMPPLSHDADKGDQDPVAYDGTAVRRLTPRECERLQGFRDDYTRIAYRGKPASDTARYAALGNSMAVPVVRWIGRKIQEVMR